MRKCWLILLTLFFCISAMPMLAQDGADLSAEEMVLQAVARLDVGYRFTMETRVSQNYLEADTALLTTQNDQQASGTVLANGDYQLVAQTAISQVQGEESEGGAYDLALISLDDDLYLRFTSDDFEEDDRFDLPVGWWRLADQLSGTDLSARDMALTNLAQVPHIAELPLDAGWIETVTELEPETIDGAAMRVFDVQMDAAGLAFYNPELSLEERFAQQAETLQLVEAGTYVHVYRLWIGAEDGQLYRVAGNILTMIPLHTALGDTYPFDMHTEAEIAFTVSDHGAVETLEIPDDPIFAELDQ